nr:Gfo/Idh/MocA family oxidoreductase [Hyphomonas sp. Mor2]
MKIGVIGAAGKIGQMRVQNVLDNPDTTLVAVHDLNIEGAKSVANGAAAFDDLDAFFAVPMDAVIISTPAHVREPICLTAYEHGLHVLAEKPLASSVESCQRIVDAAKKAGKALGGGFNMRYYPAFSYVKDVIESGQIGEIDHVRIYGGHDGLGHFTHDWEYQSEYSGGGAMWDVGIHMSDMARFVLGEITSVYGVSSNSVWNVPGSEDNAMAIFKNPNGVSAIYQASWNDWKGYKSAVEVYGSHGMVRGAYAPMENLLITMDKPGGKQKREKKNYLDVAVREKLQSWKTTAVASFADELNDFVRQCQGETGLRNADGHAAIRAIEVATAVAKSQETGQPVDLENLGEMTVSNASVAPVIVTNEVDKDAPAPEDPTLSIVLTIVQGGDYVRDFLERVRAFESAPKLDVIVPYDASISEVGDYAEEFPEVTFLDLGSIAPIRPITSEAGKHELYDRRRSAGLKAAKGDYIAILEDRGLPRPDWAATVVRLFQETGKHCIGGAIECVEPAKGLNWSFYVTDFGRYGLPFETGAADWVTDVNLAYSRWALEETRHLWNDRYHEPIVHWHLIGKGEQLWLSNEMVVDHRRPDATLGELLPERFDWGRLFGEIRVRKASNMKRLLWILAGPLIPPVLWIRHFRIQSSKGRGGRYLKSLPNVMLLSTAWTMGEIWGYITKRP